MIFDLINRFWIKSLHQVDITGKQRTCTGHFVGDRKDFNLVNVLDHHASNLRYAREWSEHPAGIPPA